jgi:hypothetical protein
LGEYAADQAEFIGVCDTGGETEEEETVMNAIEDTHIEFGRTADPPQNF